MYIMTNGRRGVGICGGCCGDYSGDAIRFQEAIPKKKKTEKMEKPVNIYINVNINTTSTVTNVQETVNPVKLAPVHKSKPKPKKLTYELTPEEMLMALLNGRER